MNARAMLRELVALVGRDAATLITRDALRSDSPTLALRAALDDAWRSTIESENEPRDPFRRCAARI